ncbi:hypothetical protein LTR49_013776 [Elasticomyces elasticus]|nr:hypothetical protein LTR49_013776 [Elasticomyces elasticus]
MATDSSKTGRSEKELCLLALDGGGVRGLSALFILRNLMERVNPDNPPKPCDYFDLIGGTSTGGLIAIMLGRLRMSVDEAITAYLKLSPVVFKHQRHRMNVRGGLQGRFDEVALEREIKELLTQQSLGETALLKDITADCKTLVCSTSKQTSQTVIFSSYHSRRRGTDMLDVVKIWEAARATSAATTFFPSIEINGEEFADGATGANNPIQNVWAEARDIWTPQHDATWRLEDNILCFVSIGMGVPSLKPFNDSNVLAMGKTLVDIAIDCQKAAEDFQRDHPGMCRENRFYRFDVDRGLGDIGLEEADKVKEIRAATRLYVQLERVHTDLEACSEKLKEREKVNTLISALLDLAPRMRLPPTRSDSPHPSMSNLDWLRHTDALDNWRTQRRAAIYCDYSHDLTACTSNVVALQHAFTSLMVDEKPPTDVEESSLYPQSAPVLTLDVQYSPQLVATLATTFAMQESPLQAGHAVVWAVMSYLTPDFAEFLRDCLTRDLLSEGDLWAAVLRFRSRDNTEPRGVRKLGRQSTLRIASILLLNAHTLDRFGMLLVADRLLKIIPVTVHLMLCGLKVEVLPSTVTCVDGDTEYRECIRSLAFEGIHSRRDQVARAESGTNEWISQHPAFLEWLEEDSAILWIQGKPGSGKSVLAKSIFTAAVGESKDAVVHLASQLDRPIVADWFYSIRGGAVAMSHVSMLKSLLYEMLMQERSLFWVFKETFRTARGSAPKKWSWRIHHLRKLFEYASAVRDSPSALILLDGFDESQSKDDSDNEIRLNIMRMLCELVEVENSRLKIIVLSRPHHDIERELDQFELCYTIVMQRENAADIKRLVEVGVRRLRIQLGGKVQRSSVQASAHTLPSQNPLKRLLRRKRQTPAVAPLVPPDMGIDDLLLEIEFFLLDKAQGVILWVLLVLRELSKLATVLFTRRDIQQKLKDLPTELYALYARIVEDLQRENDAEQMRIGQRMITWVIGSSSLSAITLVELLEALAIPEADMTLRTVSEDPIEAARYRIPSWQEFKRKLYQYCGPFVEVRPSGPYGASLGTSTWEDVRAEATDQAILVHQTARDFLAQDERASDLLVRPAEAESFVRTAVLRYLKIVFPSEQVPWVSTPLCKYPDYWRGVKDAVSYLETRPLLVYCTKMLNADEPLFLSLKASILLPVCTIDQVEVALARQSMSFGRFWFICGVASKELHATSIAWSAFQRGIPNNPNAAAFLRRVAATELEENVNMRWKLLRLRLLTLQKRYWSSSLWAELYAPEFEISPDGQDLIVTALDKNRYPQQIVDQPPRWGAPYKEPEDDWWALKDDEPAPTDDGLDEVGDADREVPDSRRFLETLVNAVSLSDHGTEDYMLIIRFSAAHG